MKASEPNWGQMILEQRASGETINDFCQSRGLNNYTFKKRKYSVKSKGQLSGASFIEIPRGGSPLMIKLKNGRSLEVGGGFNEAEVSRLIRLLESC